LLLDGMRDSFCMVASDLTAQKRNDAILADERLPRAILEQAPDAIVICDENGRIIRASKQAQAFYSENLLGQRFEHAFPLRQRDGTVFYPVGAIDTNHRQSVEARLEYNGQALDLLVSVGRLKGARNELLGSVATLTDITERKRAVQELRESQQRLNGIVSTAMDAIVTVDDKQRIVLANPAIEGMFGYTVTELQGQPLGLLIPERLRAAHTAHIAAFGESGDSSDCSRRMGGLRPVVGLRRNGEEFPIEASISQDVSTGRRYFTAILRDITERIQSDEQILRLNRVYAVLSGINALIVRVRDRDELYREACRVAVEVGGFRMAIIGIVDRGTQKVVPVASMGKDEALVSAINSLLSSGGLAANTMLARAIREKKLIVANDSQSDPQVEFGKEYAEAGVRSKIVLPLVVADEAIGSLALYASERDFFHEEELKLLTELAGDIAFAIDHLDKQARLDYLAYYDALTGLANRTLFHERLEQNVASAHEQGHKFALVLLDIERFKAINDTLGRAAGDDLLKELAARISSYVVDAGRVGRIDADHFAIMVPELQTEEELARLIEQRAGEIFGPPFRVDDSELRISARFGIAIFPADGASADTLFINAEAALKKAKASGEHYLFYTQGMNARVAENLTLENQLRQALERGEFVLHYQPKVNLASGRITSAEALIRWNDPRTGLVPPGRFIPILEETGLIYEVGRWALHQAIADYLRWRNAGLAAVRIAVNVSALQLRHHGFIDEVYQAIAIDPQAAAGLELEITESLIMADIQINIASLQTIRALGVSIAIDDFGTGFSSLSYLAKLPVDTLKIDRSFVIDITTGSQGLALVSTIINLAHALNLKVVAEGVETEEQSRLLRVLGCDEIQGFLFSQAVPGEIFETRFLAPPPTVVHRDL
ncbi:MAG: sensor domain-containing protein, partial [Thiobacillus sp.]